MVMAPMHAAPDTMSPTTDAGIPPMSTVGTPGPVMVSPVAVGSQVVGMKPPPPPGVPITTAVAKGAMNVIIGA